MRVAARDDPRSHPQAFYSMAPENTPQNTRQVTRHLSAAWGRPSIAMPQGGTQDLRDALDQAGDDFDGRVAVAFLGTQHAGKTVLCALLKDAAAKHLLRHTNGRYLGMATDGSGRINRITDALYDGRFPEKTAQGEAVPLTVEITSPENGTNLSLIFHDMAGEEYDDLLVGEMPAEDRVRQILDTRKDGDRAYGLMTHLIFAKIYVVVIDCSTAELWGSSESYVKDAIRSIYHIKKFNRDLYRDKIPADMAVVFTKHDGRPEDELADQLANSLPELDAAMKKYVGGDIKWFRSRLACAKMDRKEVERMLADKHKAKLAVSEDAVRNLRNAIGKVVQRLEAAQSDLKTATSRLDGAKGSGDPAKIKSAQSAHVKSTRRYEEAERTKSDLEDELNRALSESERIRSADSMSHGSGNGGALQRPDKPLSYNTDEYLDMIGWLIKMANRATGH